MAYVDIDEREREEVIKYIFKEQRKLLKRTGTGDGKTIGVLVIDDSAFMRKVLRDIMEARMT